MQRDLNQQPLTSCINNQQFSCAVHLDGMFLLRHARISEWIFILYQETPEGRRKSLLEIGAISEILVTATGFENYFL